MRPFGPLPLTSSSGTPSSRAKRRTEGDACGRCAGGAVGSCGGSAAVGKARGARTGAAACVVGAAAGACAAACAGSVATAAASAASISATSEPCDTLSPSLTLTSRITPARVAGISIDALSLSTVIRLCSSLTTSPGLTCTSITATCLKSPIARAAGGAALAIAAGGVAAAIGAGADAGVGWALGGAATAAGTAPSSSAINEPWFTLSPSLTFSSLTTPAALDGISIDALSLSTVTRLCSGLIASPGPTSSSMTATSLKSPMSGTRTSTNAMVVVSARANEFFFRRAAGRSCRSRSGTSRSRR